ncbi:sodium:solute symporter [candidate division KSB1 bacterium]|nr:sodium:solute symporter [candidate division KSB1 bacterium]
MNVSLFTPLDWTIVVLYFVAIGGIAWWVMKQKQKTAIDYFLASRHVAWYIIGASIFASNIGSEHVVGLASTGVKSGVAFAHYELHSWCVLLLGWVFMPFYLRSKVFTMPEFLELRFNSTSRWFLSLMSLVVYVLTKVSVTVFAGAVVFQSLMGIDFWIGALIIVIITGIYTAAGGLKAVVYTDAMHSVVLLIGSITVTLVALFTAGGWNNVVESVTPEKLNMFPKFIDWQNPSWFGLLLASPIVGIWYWCTDQCIVQRTLTAINESHARRGTIYAAYLKLFPFFIFLIPGVIAVALKNQGILTYEDPNTVFPTMVATLLPIGVRGIVAGGLLAALMSSLAAVFNGCSTLFTMDIYQKIKPNASQSELVQAGRIATIVVVALGIIWIPILRKLSGSLYEYLQNVQAFIAPPITAVFLLGIFWKRINGNGALTALITGFVLGMIKLTLESVAKNATGFFGDIANFNFLYFAPLLFAFCVILMVVISLLTPAPTAEKLKGLTFASLTAEDKAESRASWNKWDVINTIIIIGIIVLVMIYFSPLGVAR